MDFDADHDFVCHSLSAIGLRPVALPWLDHDDFVVVLRRRARLVVQRIVGELLELGLVPLAWYGRRTQSAHAAIVAAVALSPPPPCRPQVNDAQDREAYQQQRDTQGP